MAATPFASLTPTRILHVTVGTGIGDGSLAHPFHTIQEAVNAVKKIGGKVGTAIKAAAQGAEKLEHEGVQAGEAALHEAANIAGDIGHGAEKVFGAVGGALKDALGWASHWGKKVVTLGGLL